MGVGAVVVRVELDRPAEIGDRLVVHARLAVGDAADIVVRRVGRIAGDDLRDRLDVDRDLGPSLARSRRDAANCDCSSPSSARFGKRPCHSR